MTCTTVRLYRTQWAVISHVTLVKGSFISLLARFSEGYFIQGQISEELPS